jgi:hypothetical protein
MMHSTIHRVGRRFVSTVHRNKKFASVIREGLTTLNETALAVQASSHTRRPLFPTSQHQQPAPPTDKVRAEEHRLFSTAQDCLESLAARHAVYSIQGDGDPIYLLACQVKPSMQVAVLYWTLPLSILLDESIAHSQKERILHGLQQRFLDSDAEMLLQKCVQRKLASYYPPKVRLEPATEDMVAEYLNSEWD